jgi:hypothetical protein
MNIVDALKPKIDKAFAIGLGIRHIKKYTTIVNKNIFK